MHVGSLCVAQDASESSLAKKATHSANSDWKKTGWPMLKRFCLDCHNADTQEAEVDLSLLESLDPHDPASSSMQRVLEMVRFGAMPPDDAELPTEAERKQLVASLDRALYAVTCDLRPRPGKVTARRLNRAEYNNTIRDLFELDLRPADAFPSDEVGAGFDNNGDVLSLSPMQIEKYLTAAEIVANKAIIDPATLPRIDTEVPSDRIRIHGDAKTGRFNGRFLAADAFGWVDLEVPVKGEYKIRVRGGVTDRRAKPANVAVYNQKGLLVEFDDLKYFGGGGRSQSFYFHVKLEKGKHRFYLEPIERDDDRDFKVNKTKSDFYANMKASLIREGENRVKKRLKPDDKIDTDDFSFMLREVEIEGPTKTPTHLLPAFQTKLIRRQAWYHKEEQRWRDVDKAAMDNLRPFIQRAFREPVRDEDIKPYVDLVQQSCNRGGSYHRGMQIAINAILVSPRFLFRVETPPADWKASKNEKDVPLTQHQLASRLSYFLWSSTPDDYLLKEAERHRLKDKNLQAIVRRMLSDPKSESLAKQFASQWLGLRNLEEHEADTEDTFPDFDPALTSAMSRETELLFMHIVRENKPVADLLTADYTFVNRPLAEHYDLVKKDLSATEFKRISLQGASRRGLLSHASMLMLTSEATRTSPVKRGKWILENILGTPPPDPPANVPDLEDAKTSDENASLREQLEIHRDSPTCASCHRVMDQLGFGLEQFDAIGRFREKEGDMPVDASGALPGGRKFNGAAELSEVLGKTERQAFARTVVQRLLTFALGRELRPSDRCVVDEIVQQTKANDFRFVDLIQAVVQSRPFLFYENDAS